MGIAPPLTKPDSVIGLTSLTKPSFQERAERYLLAATAKSERLNKPFDATTPDLIGTSYSEDADDLSVIFQYLEEQGFVTPQISLSPARRRVTPGGYIASDVLRAQRAASTQAFVAMSFAPEMDRVYEEGFEPGIRNAGFKPMRISDKEHTNKVDDEIIAEIRRSAFLVADFTGHRPKNVFI